VTVSLHRKGLAHESIVRARSVYETFSIRR